MFRDKKKPCSELSPKNWTSKKVPGNVKEN